MKLYKFAVKNWKSDINRPFYIRKAFPSAYSADRWAIRITYETKGSQYLVILRAGEETPV